MASCTRNPNWEEDLELKDDLKLYVQRNLSQSEILNLMNVHYPMYAWTPRTLSRRLQHFGIKFINYAIDVIKHGLRTTDYGLRTGYKTRTRV